MENSESRAKAIGQFKLQLNGVMSTFRIYGMDIYIAPTILEITKLSLALHERLSGHDVPIQYNGKDVVL